MQELIWLKKMLCEILDEKSFKISLFMDNQSAIRLVKNPEFHKRSKHIDIKYHFIREQYEKGSFTLDYVPTKEMIADVFTKSLPAQSFNMLIKNLCVSSNSNNNC